MFLMPKILIDPAPDALACPLSCTTALACPLSCTAALVQPPRLFTKLGEMLVYTPLSEKSVQLLLFYVHDMLLYMKRNASVIFSLADYQDTA